MNQHRSNQRRVVEPLDKLLDRMPPHSLEAEMALLGCIILEPRLLPDIQGMLAGPEDFYSEKHAAVYSAIAAVSRKYSENGDVVLLVDHLRDEDKLELVGGADYLVELASSVPSGVNAPYYARVVSEKASLRRLIDAAGQTLHDAYHAGDYGPDGAREVIDKAQAAMLAVTRSVATDMPGSLAELLTQAMDRIEANDGRGPRGIVTGYHDLDEMTGGLQPGEMIVVAARPSMGKTSLVMNMAEQIALGGALAGGHATRAKAGVVLFSLEMSREAIVERLICTRSRVSSASLRNGRVLMKEEYNRMNMACGELHQAPIYVDSKVESTVHAVRARARRLVAERQVKVVMIDYLQLMRDPAARHDNRQTEVAAISRGLKDLARELSVPVVCVAQLNRLAENRSDNRPRMSDIRESGSIEQDADVIMMLHREEYYHRGDEDWRARNADKMNTAELIVAKQRNGATGVVRLLWDAEHTCFKNFDRGTQQAAAAGTLYAEGEADIPV